MAGMYDAKSFLELTPKSHLGDLLIGVVFAFVFDVKRCGQTCRGWVCISILFGLGMRVDCRRHLCCVHQAAHIGFKKNVTVNCAQMNVPKQPTFKSDPLLQETTSLQPLISYFSFSVQPQALYMSTVTSEHLSWQLFSAALWLVVQKRFSCVNNQKNQQRFIQSLWF